MNTHLKTGSLTFKVLHPDWDDFSSEFEIIVTSDDWKASLRFFGDEALFKDFGNKLKSFPHNPQEIVAFELGTELKGAQPEWAYYMLIRAYCYNAIGHTAIEIALNNNAENPHGQSVRCNILAEPAQINKLGVLLSEWDPMTQDTLFWDTKMEN